MNECTIIYFCRDQFFPGRFVCAQLPGFLKIKNTEVKIECIFINHTNQFYYEIYRTIHKKNFKTSNSVKSVTTIYVKQNNNWLNQAVKMCSIHKGKIF